jgi:hypothetical protein
MGSVDTVLGIPEASEASIQVMEGNMSSLQSGGQMRLYATKEFVGDGMVDEPLARINASGLASGHWMIGTKAKLGGDVLELMTFRGGQDTVQKEATLEKRNVVSEDL